MKGAKLVILDGGAKCCYFALAGAKRAFRKRLWEWKDFSGDAGD